MSVLFSSIPLLCCAGLTPAASQAPTLLLAYSPPFIGTEKKIGRTKARELVDGDKDTVIGEGKKENQTPIPPPSKAEAVSHHLLQADQCPDSFQSMTTLEARNPYLLPLIQYWLLTMTSHGMDFGQSRSAVPAVSPLSLWHTPSLLTGCRVGNKEGLDPVLFSNNQKIGALIHCFGHKPISMTLPTALERKHYFKQRNSQIRTYSSCPPSGTFPSTTRVSRGSGVSVMQVKVYRGLQLAFH